MANPTEKMSSVIDDEIDLLGFFRKIWAGRKILLVTIIFFVFLGGLYILYKRLTIIPEYMSESTMYVDSPTPELLPTLLNGTEFLNEVLKIRLNLPGKKQGVTVKDALNEYTSPPQSGITGLMGRFNAKINVQGILIVSVVMQNPFLSQNLVDSIAQKIPSFVESYQTRRLQNNLRYLTGRHNAAESAYLQSLDTLSAFYEQNARNLRLMDTIALKHLRAESDLKYDIYRELSQQLENAIIREQEKIPKITVLNPASIADQINVPKIWNLISIMIMLGIITGVGLLFVRKNRISSKSGPFENTHLRNL